MNRIFRILLTFNATSLLLIVFFANNDGKLKINYEEYDFECSYWALSFFLITIPIISSKISLLLLKYLGSDKFKKGDVVEVQYANNSFLPSYLGYFFVALSITSINSLIFVYIVLFVFTYKSQALYFNPIFLLFGFNFYNIKDKFGKTVFLITKDKIKSPSEYFCDKSYRINDFTFIEKGC